MWCCAKKFCSFNAFNLFIPFFWSSISSILFKQKEIKGFTHYQLSKCYYSYIWIKLWCFSFEDCLHLVLSLCTEIKQCNHLFPDHLSPPPQICTPLDGGVFPQLCLFPSTFSCLIFSPCLFCAFSFLSFAPVINPHSPPLSFPTNLQYWHHCLLLCSVLKNCSVCMCGTEWVLISYLLVSPIVYVYGATWFCAFCYIVLLHSMCVYVCVSVRSCHHTPGCQEWLLCVCSIQLIIKAALSKER